MKRYRPALLVVPSLALLLLLPAWAATPAANPSSTSAAAAGATAPPPEVKRTGVITGWQIRDDGTVYFRLEGDPGEAADDDASEAEVKKAAATASKQEEGRTFRLWFVTPPSQTTTKQFEFMVLHAALHLHRSNFAAGQGPTPPKLTVSSTPTEKLQGKSPEDAMPVDWVAQF